MQALFDPTFVDITPIQVVHKARTIEKYLYSLIRKGNYDFFFFYSDGIQQELSEDFFSVLKQAGLPVVAFHADDEPEVWYKKNEPVDPFFDLIASHSKRAVARRQAMGWGERVMYLPWGFNPAVFRPLDCGPAIYDVVYIGKNLFQNNVFSTEHEAYRRQQNLVDVYEFCQSAGLNFRIFGSGWDKHPVLHGCNGGVLTTDEMVRVYRQSKIVFNPGFSADGDGYQTKLRHFEVAGCGVLQITNRNPELAELFREGEEIVFYDDAADLQDKIAYYIAHEAERQAMAEQVGARAHRDHTTTQRLTELFQRAAERNGAGHGKGRNGASNPCPVPAQMGTASPEQMVRQVILKDLGEVEPLLGDERLAELLRDEESRYFHFLIGQFAVENIEYSLVRPIMEGGRPPLIAVRTFLETRKLDDNRVQRWKENICGVLLRETVRPGDLRPDLAALAQRRCPGFAGARGFRPVLNYLVRRDHVREWLSAIAKGDAAVFDRLAVDHTGLIVNDLRIDAAADGVICERPFIERLRPVLAQWERLGSRIVIYGAQGLMAAAVLAVLADYPKLNMLGLVDRRLAGATVSGHPVFSVDDLARLQLDGIVIAAESSGPQIYHSIRGMQGSAVVAPLYDLEDPLWELLPTV